MAQEDPSAPEAGDENGVTDALRAAIERTLAATAPAAGQTRERAGELVDEISKRGQGARDELARRGQVAGAEIAKFGQEARDALSRRGVGATSELRAQLDALEKRLASIEDALKGSQDPAGPDSTANPGEPKPKAEG